MFQSELMSEKSNGATFEKFYLDAIKVSTQIFSFDGNPQCQKKIFNYAYNSKEKFDLENTIFLQNLLFLHYFLIPLNQLIIYYAHFGKYSSKKSSINTKYKKVVHKH